MITIHAYDTTQQAFRSDITVDTLAQYLADPNLWIWVDFEAATPEETDLLTTVFHLDPLAVEDCIHPRQFPKLETFPDYLFWIVQGIDIAQQTHDYAPLELNGFLADTFLITYHDMPLSPIDAAKKRFYQKTSRLSQGTAYLAYEILDQLIDMYLPVLDYFDETLGNIEQAIGNNPWIMQDAQNYLHLSHQILELRRISVKNQEVFYQLSHTHQAFIDSDEARLFKDIYDHMVRVVDMSEHYQYTLRSILEIHVSLSSNRMNQVAQFLTMIATIMLPLSVVTGIYGMNFPEMPLLHHPLGFFVIIGLMVVIAGAMLYSFRRRGWI